MKHPLTIAIVFALGVSACTEPPTTEPEDNDGSSVETPADGKSDEFENEEELCRDTGGTWTDDAADAYYCLCEPDKAFVSASGCSLRSEIQSMCEVTGGRFNEGETFAFCQCPGGRILDDGNCLAPDPAEQALCEGSGGTWTDDSADSYYCQCPADLTNIPDVGCADEAEIALLCDVTGGTWLSGTNYAFCACDAERIVDHGNCNAPSYLEEQACLDTRGYYMQFPSGAYACECPVGEVFGGNDHGCVPMDSLRTSCEQSGGQYDDEGGYAYCTCLDGRTVNGVNCFGSDPIAERICGATGGLWTDDSSDSYYCVCPDGSEIYDGTACG